MQTITLKSKGSKFNMDMKRILAPIATVVLIASLGFAGFKSFSHASSDRAAHAGVTIDGAVGKEYFLTAN